ncbi:FAD binding domain-containing protein, partial [Phascolomyces articulosus]
MTSDIKKVDVLISGGGPVGLYFALRMKVNGHTFRIVDIKDEATNETRATSFSARTMEVLQNQKLAHYILQESQVLQGTQIFANGKFRGQVNMDGDTSFQQITSIAQRETEKIFARLLGEENIDRHTELVSYQQHDGGIEATVKDLHTGKNETIHARYIVGADGTHSAVRKLADDWTFEGYSLSTRFAIGDVAIEGKDAHQIPRTRGTIFINGSGIGGFIPIEEEMKDGNFFYRFLCTLSRYELDANSTGDPTHGIDHNDKSVTVEQVQTLMNDGMHPLDLKIKATRHLSIFRINSRKANGFRRNRAFLIGDAAHCHSPFGGQGLNLGIQDADNLSWKLSMVLNGYSSDPERLLNSYTVEREPLVDATMKGTGSGTKTSVMFSSLIAFISPILLSFDFIMRPVVTSTMQLNTRIPSESTLLFQKPTKNSDGLIAPGDFMRETVSLRKRIIDDQILERKTLHDILQNETSQYTVLWISTRPSSDPPCEWTRDFWNKYHDSRYVSSSSSTVVRPMIIESSVHTTQCKVPSYVDLSSTNNKKGNVKQMFWAEEQWNVQNSLTKRIGLDKHVGTKPETPAAIIIVRPDLYVAYSNLVKSPADIDNAFEFLASYF